jgi:hypothetical protein
MHPSPTADTSRPWLPNFRLVNMSFWMLAHLPPVQPSNRITLRPGCKAPWCTVKEMPAQEQNSTGRSFTGRSWIVGVTSFFFILLQSACTAVMAISGVRVIIGLGALAAAAGLNRPASGFHADAIRIPMMAIALIGSFVNLYVIWRIRTLRSRPSSQWRTTPATPKQKRAEAFQIVLAVITLALVLAEWITHRIVHNA